MKIGKIIKMQRKEHGWSLAELAKRASISKSFLWEMEQGSSDISFTNLHKVTKALSLDIVFSINKMKATP